MRRKALATLTAAVVTAGMFVECGNSVSSIAPTEKEEMTAKEGQAKQADQVEGAQMPEEVPTAPAKAPAEAPKTEKPEAAGAHRNQAGMGAQYGSRGRL